MDKKKRIGLLFDSLRSPYDIANIIQVAIALDCDIYTSGSCIDFNNPKIVGKVKSWQATTYPRIKHFEKIEDAINEFHKMGKKVYGTSPRAISDFYNINAVDEDVVVAFGTETTGLSSKAMAMMDGVTKLPMQNLGFLTLSIAVPAVAYELNRQMNKVNIKTEDHYYETYNDERCR